MNKLLILLLLSAFYFFSFDSLAQNPPLLFEDTFKSNNNGWYSDESIFRRCTLCGIAKGKFIVLNNDPISFVKPFEVDVRKDFAVELTFSITKGSTNGIVMLVFQDEPIKAKNFLTFSVRSKNQFAIFNGTVDEQIELVPYTSFPNVILDDKNTIRVEKKGTKTSFSINNKNLITKEGIEFPGNSIGMKGGRGMVIYNRFSVYYKNDGTVLPIAKTNQENEKELLGPTIQDVPRGLSLVLSPDGNTLFVNARDKEDNLSPHQYGCDDIYFSMKTAKGDWGIAQRMPSPINGPENNDIISISADNNTILMGDTDCYNSVIFHHYISHRTASGWSPLKRMIMHDVVNESVYSNSVLSPDGKTLIIYLKTKEAKGDSDMYISHLLKDSTWSKPLLISQLNTEAGDTPCFIAADNKTFYFASDGRPGYGNMDIYMTKRLDDTWQNWSVPKNMGPEINGEGWDNYFITDAKGEYGYFISDDNYKYEHTKFFRIKLKKEHKASPVLLVKGKVLNAKTKAPVNAILYYEVLSDGIDEGVVRVNPSTGEYKLLLPYGKHYGYRAEAKGFFTVNENFDLVDEKEYVEIERNLLLVPIEVGQTIKLNNIFFVQSKTELLSSSYPELNRLAILLKENPTISIELRGYTDNIGDPKKNIVLSEDRVNVVRTYLINSGISASRITGKGLGGTNIISNEGSEDARKLNRRVEFVILSK